jgi:hypothetical protein
MTVLEPAVTLTDFALAIECGLFAVWLRRCDRTRFTAPFVALFAASSVSALLGGISHGFLPGAESLWRATLIAICVAALAAWVAAARLALPERAERIVTALAALAFLAQAAYILFVDQSFTAAIVSYVPAALFLLIAFALVYRSQRSLFLLAGIAGLALTFVAAAVQQTGIGLHPRFFDHNAFYHLLQALAFFLIFWTARALVESSSG